MEEDRFYSEQLESLLPSSVARYVKVIYSAVLEESVDGSVSKFYRDTPVHPYDLLFIDGPRVRTQLKQFDGDILKILEWNASSFEAYIDGRKFTRETLMRLMPYVKIKHNSIHSFTHITVPDKSGRSI